jgi:hypothetical protein
MTVGSQASASVSSLGVVAQGSHDGGLTGLRVAAQFIRPTQALEMCPAA